MACFRDNEAGDFYAVCGDMNGHKYTIQCIQEADYVMKLFITHGFLSKRCSKTSLTYKNRGETVNKKCCYPEPMEINFLYRNHIDGHNHCSN